MSFACWHLLLSRPVYVFPAEEIIQTVWGAEGDVILAQKCGLSSEKKLEEEGGNANPIKTWPGGYSFVED
ncbi:MAG: winged helix-turn-helix domain-containing protein [Anaerolineales bacterium]|nr:winged helix-turn-helix domain-containing protein [Anaerolineales bacterium]